MKISRKKRCKKSISIYKHLFNIKPPYKVLVDRSLTSDALDNKIYLKEQIPILLNDKSYLYSTRCVLNGLQQKNQQNLVSSAIRRYRMHKCNHDDTHITPNDCILSTIGNGNSEGFIVATNDQRLIIKLRQRGVPVIRLVKNVLVLDKPSRYILSQKTHVDRLKLLNEVKQQSMEIKVKKRKKKEPNPLSCLKKKKKTVSKIKKVSSDGGGKRRRFKKIKLNTEDSFKSTM
ncbi:rRNA-processing protein UTP23 homolog [Babesia microti strain RI]|uniref:rRNA-processing protein UTP23 homolog n=1 Tax=Babesia microti (strain RI) TaxID=1133968 RepID=A0A1N6LXG2_BABMR|nr:rRNA-processing protein UTP23 homolog [Babesia microti strain RI]SIO73570.1 rRNA-processing protein UTP23 homolog [Babesia microti strain RI]|eukprot:XP_021337657.1 rRNA-processing protein UTP23 homolog [Babesia microti strain RI]